MPNPTGDPKMLAHYSTSLTGIVPPGTERMANVLITYDVGAYVNGAPDLAPTGTARLFDFSASAPVLPDDATTPMANPITLTSPPAAPGRPGLDVRGTVSFYTDAGYDLLMTVTVGPTVLGPFPIKPVSIGAALGMEV